MLDSFPIEPNVERLDFEGRQIYLVGTAHVSKESAELAERIVKEIRPDSVAVELCDSRFQSLQDPERWKNTDIVSAIRKGKVYVLMTQLALAGFQKKLGLQLDVKPGAEMLSAIAAARETGSNLVLADRDVTTTLKRSWSNLGFFSGCKVLAAMLEAIWGGEKIDASEIEKLKSSDMLESIMKEFSAKFPLVRKSLIDERDQYLAAKIRQAPGKSVVAIVGAGHVPGIKQWLDREIDLKSLESIPPKGKTGVILGWLIPLAVVGMMIAGFFVSGGSTSVQMMETWFWINGIFAGLGAALALGHPLTVIAAFLSAPFTTLHPLIGSGWVAALVEAMMRRPRISDLESVADDITSIKGVLNNRVCRIFLVLILTSLFGVVGMLLGVKLIASFL